MAVFAAMLVFFTVLHPIPIMDEDDVIYTVLVRKAIPLPGSWNPSRMMPEVLMSLVGNLSGLATAPSLRPTCLPSSGFLKDALPVAASRRYVSRFSS